MASTYNSLGIELMATGENAGTWGTKTNTNLDLVKETWGYLAIDMAGADVTLAMTDGASSNGRNFNLELTGTLAATRTLNIPATAGDPAAAINKAFIVYDNTTHGAYSLTFKVTGQTGVTLAEGKKKIVYHNGTDIIDVELGGDVVDDTSPQLGGNLDVNGNSIISVSNGNIPLAPNGTGEVVIGSGSADADITSSGAYDLILDTNTGTNSTNITITNGANGDVTVTPNGTGELVVAGNSGNPGTLTLGADTDDTGSFSASFAQGVLTESTTYILPTAFAGTTGDVLTSTDAGVLSWATPAAGGTSWQAVVVASGGSSTAVAGEGYFINTTSGTHTLNLPGSPSIGDEVNVIDYAGTFDTNNLTVGRGGNNIHGAASDLTVATERAGFCLVYSDGTQGWLLKDK